jgi:hypothetical protein
MVMVAACLGCIRPNRYDRSGGACDLRLGPWERRSGDGGCQSKSDYRDVHGDRVCRWNFWRLETDVENQSLMD